MLQLPAPNNHTAPYLRYSHDFPHLFLFSTTAKAPDLFPPLGTPASLVPQASKIPLKLCTLKSNQQYAHHNAHLPLVKMQQRHTTNCFHLKNITDTIPICDALVTELPDVALCIQHADCQATCIYDYKRKNIAAIHAGWRGQVAGIYATSVKALKDLGSHPNNLFVFMAPSLGPCCAEIAHPPENFTAYHMQFANKNMFFNLWEMAHSQLTLLGIPSHQIVLPSKCTKCTPNLHSYRRDKTAKRNSTVVGML